jgi:hypothetical protein
LPRIVGAASVDTFLRTMERRREPLLFSIMGGALLVAGVLIALGLALGPRKPPALATAAPLRATALPIVVLLPPTESLAAATSLAAAGDRVERRRHGRRRARLRDLPADLTLNPF